MPDPAPDNTWFTEIFDFNGFVSQPYTLTPMYVPLRRLFGGVPEFMDEFVGDAFQVGAPGKMREKNLVVPPNTLAALTLADGQCLRLGPGRYRVSKVLRGQRAISVHFINTQERSFRFENIAIYTQDHLALAMDVQLALQVDKAAVLSATEKAEALLQWADPKAALGGAVCKELIIALAKITYDEARQRLATHVAEMVSDGLADFFKDHALVLKAILLTRLHPSNTEAEAALKRRQRQLDFMLKLEEMDWDYKNKMRDLELRGSIVDVSNEIQRREVQAEEDVAALRQPAGRRKSIGEQMGQARERNQAARMEAIEAVSEIAKALAEEMHKHPGRVFTAQDMEPLKEALKLLDKLSDPNNYAPPASSAKFRSFFATPEVGATPPPVELPDKLPVPSGSVWAPAPEPTQTS